MVTEQEINDAAVAAKAAHEVYVAARDKHERLRVTRACEEYKVGIGMFVTDKRGRKGVVIRVEPWDDSKPWVYAKEIRKDGSQGERELSMYSDWSAL